MRPRKIIAMVMTFLMMLSLLPSLVFAEAAPEGELGGQLKIKGTAAVGSELSADYEKVTPEGLTDDYVTFSWSRKVGDQLTEVGTEKTYKLVDEDLGNKIELKITGKAEMGITGGYTGRSSGRDNRASRGRAGGCTGRGNPCSGDRSRGYTCGRFPDR